MKKLIILLLLCITTSASGQFFAPNQKPNLGLQVNWGHSLSKGLVGCWLFNEGSGRQIFDLSWNRNDGTDVSSPLWVPGQYGPAKRYDGTDDYTDCGTGDTLKAGSSDFSLEVYMSTTTSVNRIIAGRGNSGTNGKRYGLFILGAGPYNGKIQLYLDDDANPGSLISSNTYNEGKKHHIVGVRDGNWMRLYVDGIAETPVDITNLGNLDDTEGFKIGGIYNNDSSEVASFFPGDIEFVKAHNRALSPSEIIQLYSKPFCFMQPSWNWSLYSAISVTPSGQVIFINTR